MKLQQDELIDSARAKKWIQFDESWWLWLIIAIRTISKYFLCAQLAALDKRCYWICVALDIYLRHFYWHRIHGSPSATPFHCEPDVFCLNEVIITIIIWISRLVVGHITVRCCIARTCAAHTFDYFVSFRRNVSIQHNFVFSFVVFCVFL